MRRPLNERGCWVIEIHAGRGPTEVCQFLSLLAGGLSEQAATLGFEVRSKYGGSRFGGSRSARLRLFGPETLPLSLEQQTGTHVLINAARGRGARKRWFVGVGFWRDEPASKIRTQDIRFETCRAGGSGGQHVNTTESAVRAVHRPTGLSVRVENERSQLRNKAAAARLLGQRLRTLRDDARREQQQHASVETYRFERGQAVRFYELDKRGRLKPLRHA